MFSSDRDKGTVEMAIAMLLSGTIGYFVIQSNQPFWNVVFFRCLIGALSLLAYMLLSRTLSFKLLDTRVLKVIFIGGITLVGNWVMLFASFDYIPFSIATIAYHMQPIMLVIIGTLLSHQLPSKHIVFWLLIAFIGLWLVVGLSPAEILHIIQADSSSGSVLWGVALALGAALLYTVTTLLTKRVSHIPSRIVALIHVITGCVFLLPMVDFQDLPNEMGRWGDLITLGVINTGFMYIMLYNAFQRLTTNLIAILSFIYPVTALVVDYFAFGHAVNLIQGAGVVMILLAVCAVKFNWELGRLFKSTSSVNKQQDRMSV